MKVLVLGGSRYFGLHLIEDLMKTGHHVTVATRGNKDFKFKNQVQFVVADREKLEDLQKLATLGPFDVIYDQICMSGKAANNSVIAFKNACKRYVFTSTGSVYDAKKNVELKEELFDYKNYPLNLEDTNPYNYQEAKRQAEVVFGNQNYFKAVMVRFPIVLGLDDYTERLKFHVQRVRNQQDIYFPDLEMKMTFVDSQEAGRFLRFVGESTYEGSVNCADTGAITMRDLMTLIETIVGKKAILAEKETEGNHSPFGFPEDFILPNARAQSLGFKFKKLQDYLPELIRNL
jgi:nucleoside-diphosphate-sugar epimerase